VSEPSKTWNEQSRNESPTRDEASAEIRAFAARISELRKEQERFRREWPKNVLIAVKTHIYGLFKRIEGKEELDVECFMAVYEATSVFLEFLQEEKRYIKDAAGKELASSGEEDER
jgi:hypothetical protein